ncbi:hypothetical protein [Nocardia amikacinitolerans]|uniref:hypothetical protein n=1 Tax=Nocardia amikacinitolerans TaxID=756689 RepID=UPI001C5484A7|nr:hypothetical protein [Nocardia amikacinitolerans]
MAARIGASAYTRQRLSARVRGAVGGHATNTNTDCTRAAAPSLKPLISASLPAIIRSGARRDLGDGGVRVELVELIHAAQRELTGRARMLGARLPGFDSWTGGDVCRASTVTYPRYPVQ